MKTGHLAPCFMSHGEEGLARLAAVARMLVEPTRLLLDRSEPLQGCTAVDAGCGSGDVAFELAKRVGEPVKSSVWIWTKTNRHGPGGRRRGIPNIEFCCANVARQWPVRGVSLVCVRFVLTHLVDPGEALKRLRGTPPWGHDRRAGYRLCRRVLRSAVGRISAQRRTLH